MTKVNFVHFKFLPMSMRVLFTMVLLVFGVGYLFAMIHVWVSHAGRDGEAMLTARDLQIAYGGDPKLTRLEGALRGSMKPMLPDDAKRQQVFDWLHQGAPQADYETKIKPILEMYCIACHNPATNPQLVDLGTWQGVSSVAAPGGGKTLSSLVRTAHVHLFAIPLIFFIVAFIFTHAYIRPVWLKCLVIALPFALFLIDVASWYLTKLWPGAAWVVLISGVVMGICFAFMWFASMWQMWIGKVPSEVSDSAGHVPGIHGNN